MFFSKDDLIENKEGSLSLKQKIKLKKDSRIITLTLVGTGLVLGTVITIFLPQGIYFGLAGFFILTSIGAVYYKKAEKAILSSKVFAVCGIITFDYRNRMSYVKIQNEIFVFNDPKKFFIEGNAYCIYYSFNNSILSFEEKYKTTQ